MHQPECGLSKGTCIVMCGGVLHNIIMAFASTCKQHRATSNSLLLESVTFYGAAQDLYVWRSRSIRRKQREGTTFGVNAVESELGGGADWWWPARSEHARRWLDLWEQQESAL
jgi:hypothetical protein